ncbi:MOSC domain-containing protein [Acidovorax sp.]|uniref:MOSC domain-containing protein n=1 Tax=Acidovorax sp. TaxID=1872122 RepID=UPI00260CA76F|nr:MOSC domain-containing protein [Acidovorax sp.]
MDMQEARPTTPEKTLLSTAVLAVHKDGEHRFSKQSTQQIHLLQGLGVEGDAHCGSKVQHRSRVKANPDQPNLRQVHLISASLLEHVQAMGFEVAAGQLGENITLASAPGLRWDDLIALPVGTRVVFESTDAPFPTLELTGLRNPCPQIDAFQPGLLAALLGKTEQGQLLRKAGVMAVVRQGGFISPGCKATFQLPHPPHRPMERV